MGCFQPDVWLSEQIGKPAYRWQGITLNDLPPGPCFCYAKVPETNHQEKKVLEDAGFTMVETSVIYQKQPSRVEAIDPRLREAQPADCKRVNQIANYSFRFSRFHADPGFEPTMGNRIKEAWAGNFFQGNRGQRMLVAEESKSLAGFILLLEKTDATVVDLIAVDPAFRGRGLGRALLLAAERKGRRIVAGTQQSNLPSCQMYLKCGYTVLKKEWVFHLHK